MNLFPPSLRKRIVKEEQNRAKNSYTVKMMVPSTGHWKIKEWVWKKVTANAVLQSLQNAPLVTDDTEREWNFVQRLGKFSVDGHTLN